MRFVSFVLWGGLALGLTACGGDSGDDADGSAGGADGATGGSSSGTGGRTGTGDADFADLPGKIRFGNFVSDGEAGVDLDIYWGLNLDQAEKLTTLAYGEISEFAAPRRIDSSILATDEARYFVVKKGDLSGTPASFLNQTTEKFVADTVITVTFASTENFSGDALNLSAHNTYETDLPTPPTGMALVYEWTGAFDQIEGGDFVLVGTGDQCMPDPGDSGDVNLGTPVMVPGGTSDLALYDANTEPPCSTGPSVDGSVEAGHVYVVIGKADTFDVGAREAILLELGAQ